MSGSTSTSSTSTQITINVPFGGTRAITIYVAGVVNGAAGSSASSGISVPSKYTISGSATANVSL